MVDDKVLLKCTAFKGIHKIWDQWENTIYEVIEQPLGKIPVLKIKSMEGDDKIRVVHRIYCYHYSLILQIEPAKSDNKSMVDQTVSIQVVIVVSGVASHVHNLSTYSRVQVANVFQRGLEFVTALLE